ncbi:hypothetical protein V2J09_011969 [Rumex salicifolius]
MGSGSMIDNKWAATVASIWIQSTSGTPSTFGIYSSVLKSSQSYSQTTLDTVALFKDLGANFGVLSGFLYTFAVHSRPRNHLFGGPKLVIIAGSIQCFLGYFLIWLTVTGAIRQPPVAVVCLFMFLAGHSMPFFNTADVVTAVNNFRGFSGTAVGMMKGFLGLSGAILIQVYRTIFKGKQTEFLLLVSIVSTLNPLWLMWFVKIHDQVDKDEKWHLDRLSLVILVIAVYLIAVIILESIFTLQLWSHILILVFLLFLLSSPLFIALRLLFKNSNEKTILDSEQPVEYSQLPSNDDTNTTPIEPELNLNLWQAMSTLDFWLLFISTACAFGSGLATLNNITQIGESLGYSSTVTSTLVSLWGIVNSVGRFGAGYASDYVLNSKGLARPLFMAIALATMSIGHAVIASGFSGALYIGTIVVALCYGSQLSLMPIITSEIFGVVNMGTIFNTITIAGPIGSYVLSVRVVGYIYDQQASTDDSCTGVHCFMASFFIMAGVTLAGSLAAILLFFRTSLFYQEIVRQRIQRSLNK